MKQLVAFDLDGTLAESKQALERAMSEATSIDITREGGRQGLWSQEASRRKRHRAGRYAVHR
jgi:phosphoglycolate phosphatase-like HAD superfamily hydrolase